MAKDRRFEDGYRSTASSRKTDMRLGMSALTVANDRSWPQNGRGGWRVRTGKDDPERTLERIAHTHILRADAQREPARVLTSRSPEMGTLAAVIMGLLFIIGGAFAQQSSRPPPSLAIETLIREMRVITRVS